MEGRGLRLRDWGLDVLLVRLRLLLLLLDAVVDNKALLTSHGIINGVETRLARNRLDDRLQAVLELLLVESHAGDGRGGHGLLLAQSQIQILKLLGHVEELLLQALLLGGEIEVGRHQILIQPPIHLPIAHVDRGRRKHLFRQGVHGTVEVQAHVQILVQVRIRTEHVLGKRGCRRGLGDAVGISAGRHGMSAAIQTNTLLLVPRGRKSGGFGSGPQTGQQMRTAGPRSRDIGGLLRFIDRSGRYTQTLDVRTFSSRSETRTRNANRTAVERGIVRHLSKTASVHTHGSWSRIEIKYVQIPTGQRRIRDVKRTMAGTVESSLRRQP